MDARFYNSEEIDLEKLANDFENMFRMQAYETQLLSTNNKEQILVQLKKGGDLIALIGLQTALTVTFQHTTGGIVALLGKQKWVDKAAVGAVGLIAAPILWPLMITAGAGAIKQANLTNEVLNTIDMLVQQQRPGVQAGPIPMSMQPQFQQFWSAPTQQQTQPQYTPPATPVYTPPVYTPPATPVYTPPAAKQQPRCPSCNTPYESGDTFCSGCGRPLTPPKTLCPNCNTEIKPGVAFCPSCGSSIFQATQAQAAKKAAPVYTPPKKETPVYTPPKPVTPVYTPPAPTVAAQQPTPQPYIPPVPQDPPVIPQPSITLIPGKPKTATPADQQVPKSPPVPVYIPPTPVQPPVSEAKTQTTPQPIKAQPSSQSTFDPNTPWGSLIFGDGTVHQLTGERVLIGRYDHDLGGVQPEVDLGSMTGADTVSRGHATLEHIGSTYQLTDLNSTNLTRVNGKSLDANVPTPITDGDTLQFGKIVCTFKQP